MTWNFLLATYGSLIAIASILAFPDSFAAYAHSADAPDAAWFNSLKRDGPVLSSCCGPADCKPIDDWNVEVRDGSYRVRDPRDGHWLQVPREAISHRTDNPTGKYVACINYNMADPTVICFILGPRT